MHIPSMSHYQEQFSYFWNWQILVNILLVGASQNCLVERLFSGRYSGIEDLCGYCPY